jgi:hypothetical protein
MYSTKDLTHEVRAVIEGLMMAKSIVMNPDWITRQVINDHELPEDDFFVCCSQQAVRAEVRTQLSRFKVKAEAEADKQITLPGFERLQEYYLVERDNSHVAVHILDLTNDELDSKYVELMAMGQGCFAHAKEIKKYMSLRNAA